MKIIDRYRCDKRNRNYNLLESEELGKIIYYTTDANNHETVSYKNISNHDIFWNSVDIEEFEHLLNIKPVETFASKRLKGFQKDKIILDCGNKYHIMRRKECDGYLYEVDATQLRAFPATRYPDMKFVYTKYRIESMKRMDKMYIEKLKTDETVRFNGNWRHSVHDVSVISDAIYDFASRIG